MSDITRKTKEKIEQILQNRDNEIKALTKKQKELKDAMEKASKNMQEALLANDTKRYKEWKKKREDIEIDYEVCLKKLELLEKKELVSNEDNKQIRGNLEEAYKELSRSTREKIYSLVKQINEIRADFYEEEEAINTVLNEWHNKIFKQQKQLGWSGEQPLLVEDKPRCMDEELCLFLNMIYNNKFCEKYDLMAKIDRKESNWFMTH